MVSHHAPGASLSAATQPAGCVARGRSTGKAHKRTPRALGREHLGLERGHRTLTVTRKGGKVMTIPLVPRTARAIDLAIGGRTDGPVFLARDRRRLDRHGAGRIVRKIAQRAGIAKTVTLLILSPPTLRAPPCNPSAGISCARRPTTGRSCPTTDLATSLP
jgi:hypothetical protein